MSGETVTLSTPDGHFTGYLSLPPQGSGAGLVIIQEIFGVNKVMRDVSDFFAAAGFVCFCPDLFWRIEPNIQLTDQSEEEWAQAFDLFGKFNHDTGINDIQASLSYLRQHDSVSGKVGTIGYCLGGLMAYLSSTRTDTDASVGYYGVSINHHLNEATNIPKPLMLHIAEKDGFVPPEAQKDIIECLASIDHVTLHTYPDRDHAFARIGGEHYDATDANLANTRSIDFLNTHLS